MYIFVQAQHLVPNECYMFIRWVYWFIGRDSLPLNTVIWRI